MSVCIFYNRRNRNTVIIKPFVSDSRFDRITNEYLSVNSCGYYEIADTEIKTVRPNGRSDYQIIYIADGRAEFYADGAYQTAEKGDLLVYRPHEPQDYAYCPNCSTKVYWIHFTGTGAGDILSCSGLSEKRRYHIGICDEIGLNVIDLAREIRLARPGYELFCRSILISVIASAVRALNTSSRHEHSHKYDKIKSVIDKMSICMNDTSTIQDYARECCIDKYYFITPFKEYTGYSPHAYRTMIKIEKAKQLLADTTMTNCQIAAFLGYKDSLYFSRIFKKYTGISPYAYKQNLQIY